MTNFIVHGGTSLIARQVLEQMLGPDSRVVLTGRDAARLEIVARHLSTLTGAACDWLLLEDASAAAVAEAARAACRQLGQVDVLLIAQGNLPDQARCEEQGELVAEAAIANWQSPVIFCLEVARVMEAAGQGRIGIISSVAGDRARRSNFIYGSLKAGLSAFAAGLRQRLRGSGVSVTLIKPGPVDTPMTAGMKKGGLMANPAMVGGEIARALRERRSVLYTPGYWRAIMWIIRGLPEFVLARMRF